MPRKHSKKPARTLQELIFRLGEFWSQRGCVMQQPYDVEVGAGTMCPETFLRVLGPEPYRVAYVQPSRRPADGRYGENPNRLYKHLQMQVILKPPPGDIQEMYLTSLEQLGIDLRHHDLKFEEDNWEAPTLGAWGIGWQVMLDGLEITQFTYLQQCGGLDLDPISVELTYGLERIAAFLQDAESVYSMLWSEEATYGQVRLAEELQFSVYQFEMADIATLGKLLDLYEQECQRLLEACKQLNDPTAKVRFPLLPAYDLVLKCSHLFNLLDSRGAISVTERVAVISRVRALACGVAAAFQAQPPIVPDSQSVPSRPSLPSEFLSDKSIRGETTVVRPDAAAAQRDREAMADALLQELDAIAETIEGEFDSAEDMRRMRQERANRL